MSISRGNLRFQKTAAGLGGSITEESAEDLFPDVSGVEAERGFTDYACFYFVNRDSDPDGLFNPHIWFESRTGSEVSLGFDPIGKNGTAQSIPTRFTAPVGVVFSQPDSELSSMWLSGDPYRRHDKIAIWARRVVPKGAPVGKEGFHLKVRGESY